MPFLERLRTWRRQVTAPAVPPKCPACDCRLPLEPLGGDRFLCHGCAKDFRAIRTPESDWRYDTRPLRYLRRSA
jgi:hypothetical protein